MAVADLYLVGAPKCGTTTVARWLADHRDVFWSVPKEPYYWATDFPRMRTKYDFRNRADYEALYCSPEARAARYRGDGSTTYLYSHVAVPTIHREVPEARYVVCLRNPVEMMPSYHRTQTVAQNESETDFVLAWRRSLTGRPPATRPLDPKLVDYPVVGRLGAALERLYATLPREQVHLIWMDDLVDDPVGTWRRLAGNLGLDADPVPDLRPANVSTKTHRFPALHRFQQQPPDGLLPAVRSARRWVQRSDSPAVRRLRRTLWRPEQRPEVTEVMRRELAAFFADDITLLEGLTGRDLSAWRSPGAV